LRLLFLSKLSRPALEAFVSVEAVEACTVPGRLEMPPVPGTRYIAFTDPAGGSGTDSMTLAIAHAERDTAVLDLVRSRKPPFSPESVIAEFSADVKRYGLHEVHGDKYAGGFPPEQFVKNDIRYRASEKTKSEIYQSMLPKLNSGRVELLDNKVLRTQLIGLERRTARSGKDSIDHPRGGHDDLINAAAGCLVQCTPSAVLGPEGFATSGERRPEGFHTETFENWAHSRGGGRTLFDQLTPEEKAALKGKKSR
jgi:hypothetical protein